MPGFDIGTFGQGVAGEAAGGILGMILGGYNDRRQLDQQKQLQKMQEQGNKRMMDYSQQKQFEMWLKTNYPAQMQQLEKAGLNPGLIYGMSGGGGATTGSAQGNVTGASAQQNPGEIQAMAGMGIQSALTGAQIKLMEAQAKNLDADTTKKGGVDTTKIQTEIEKLAAETTNEKAKLGLINIDKIIKSIEANVAGQTQEATIDIIKTNQLKALEELERMQRENLIGKSTQWAVIDTIRAHAIGAVLDNELKRAGIKNIEADTKLKGQAWEQNIEKLQMAWRQDGREGLKATIERERQTWGIPEGDPGEKIINNVVDAIQSILLLKTITTGPAKREPIGYR